MSAGKFSKATKFLKSQHRNALKKKVTVKRIGKENRRVRRNIKKTCHWHISMYILFIIVVFIYNTISKEKKCEAMCLLLAL